MHAPLRALRARARTHARTGGHGLAVVTAIVVCAMTAALSFTPVVSAQTASPSGFHHWRGAELTQHDAELSKHVGADHSSRETLHDYGDHRFRMLYRDADGNPEQHDVIIDIVYVQSGEGALMLGGTMSGKRATTPGEWIGTKLEGGTSHPLGAGDILHIPAGVPHSFLVPAGKHITYVLLKIPAKM
jgi:mannose-6-phosphate isomerase-like protein (cupin superfamily)